jgi:pyruvate/2-oxoglutarate dehydrogenase complex dihydrolipoamide acyltransferase (E2) component
LQDADKKGLGTIGEEVKQLAQRARDNSLKPQDYEVWIAWWMISMKSTSVPQSLTIFI